METKPNSFMVGLIVLLILIAGAGFVIWFSKLEIGTSHNLYQIDFEGAVTGLRENEDVLYKGIAIGKVKKIRVFKEDVNRVKVIVDIKRPDIIRESSIASIEAQGLTGYTFVQIKGSDQNSPLLAAEDNQKYPVIRSKKSNIETLFTKAPEMIEHFSTVAQKLGHLFDDDMIKDTKSALKHIKVLTSSLSEGSCSLKSIMGDIRSALANFNKATSSFETIMTKNEVPIAQFMETGLPAFTAMMQKVDGAAEQLSDLTKMIQQGPLTLLQKSPHQGYKVK